MAGRPLKQAKTVLDFENKNLDLEIDFFIATPDIYRDPNRKIGPNDHVSKAWNAANKAVFWANQMIAHLGDVMRNRAGIDEPGPAWLLSNLDYKPEAQPSPGNNGDNGEQGRR